VMIPAIASYIHQHSLYDSAQKSTP